MRIRRIFFLLKKNKKFRVFYNPFERKIFLIKGETILGDLKLLFWIFKKIRGALSIMYSLLIYFTTDYIIFKGAKIKKIKIAKLLRKKIIYDFYTSKYDTYVLDRKKYLKNSKKAQKMKNYDKYVLENSDLTIFLNEAEADYYCKVVGVDISKINYKILLIVTEKKPTARLDFFYNKREVFNICWWGSYIPLHGLDKIINTMKVLKYDYEFKFKLYILGNSKQKSILYEKIVDENNLNGVIEIRNDLTFADNKLDKFLEHNCDLALGIFGQSRKAKTVISNKVVEACAMKIPILTGFSTGMHEYFDPDDDNYLCENNVYVMAKKIIYISNNKRESLKRANNNFLIYKNNFSIERLGKKLNEIFDYV